MSPPFSFSGFLPKSLSGPDAPSAALRHAVLGLLYLGLALLGLQLGSGAFDISPIWPASGFALAVLYGFGYRFLPALLAGELAANLIAGTSWPVSMGITVASLAGPAVGAVLLRGNVRVGQAEADSGDMWHFLLIAGIVAAGLSAILGTGFLLLQGEASPGQATDRKSVV